MKLRMWRRAARHASKGSIAFARMPDDKRANMEEFGW